MGNYSNKTLTRYANMPRLLVRNVYCGHFAGEWKGAVPVNRLIYIFASGAETGSIRDADTCCFLRPGTWLLIPSEHEVAHVQRPGLRLVSIHFNVELFPRTELLSECRRLYHGRRPELKKTLLPFMDSGLAFVDALGLPALLWRFVLPAVAEHRDAIQRRMDGLAEFTPLLDAFDREPYRDFTVDEMAATMKMGRESFVKRFASATGVPPKAFFNRIRAAATARELADRNVTVREVAERFGFSSEFYFSRFFKQHLKKSPREYRKNLS